MLVPILKASELFQSFSDEELFLIDYLCERQTLEQGETVFREGESTDRSMYFIEDGIVKIIKGSGSRHKVLAMFGVGNIFGEMSFLDGRPRSATAVADERAQLRRLSPEKMGELEARSPAIALKLLKVLLTKMAARLRQTDEELLSGHGDIIIT